MISSGISRPCALLDTGTRDGCARLERADHARRIGRLELLRRIAGELHVPDAVFEEVVRKGAGRPGSAEVAQASGFSIEAFAR
jgi:hypothetical protein